MVQFVISDYAAKTAGLVYYNSGVLRRNITDQVAFQDNNLYLPTSCRWLMNMSYIELA